MTPAPQLTVVIVSTLGGALLDETFRAVADQADDRVEIVVAARRSAAEGFEADRYPFPVLAMRMEERASIPELCAAGVLAARGTIVALTNDHFVAAPGWIAAIRRAHVERPQAGVIGGAIERAVSESPIDRAVYDCEYAQFGVGVPAGPCRVPGPNASYTRAALAEIAPLLKDPTWELYWHRQLQRRGVVMERDPRIRVRHRCSRTVTGFLRERYLFSRSLAGERVKGATVTARIGRGLGSFLLPPLLIARLLRRQRHSDTHRGRPWRTVPLLILFTLPWAWGEVVGSLRGAGDATRRLR